MYPCSLQPVIDAVGDSFYKITSEALLVLQELVVVIRPFNDATSFEYKPYVKEIYFCTLQRLKAADIDQEVKERAISCMYVNFTVPLNCSKIVDYAHMCNWPRDESYATVVFLSFRGQILHSFGDELSSELHMCLPILLERLRNEITRLTAVKALTLISR